MTLADNSVLFDAIGRATNVLWVGHTAHGKILQIFTAQIRTTKIT